MFINWTTFDAFSVKGGRFKMPFGLEQNTSVSDLDFAYRTLGSVKIAPGRDTGVMAYGELLSGSLVYEAGVFDDDGDNGELEAEQFVVEGQDLEDIGPSVAAARGRRALPAIAGARSPEGRGVRHRLYDARTCPRG